MTKHYTDEGTLLIRNSDIKDGRFEFGSDPIYLETSFAEENASRMHKLGDVITVHTGDVGTSAVITENEANSIGFATIVTRPNQEIICSEYLCTFLNTEKHKRWAIAISTGDGRTNYNLGDYFELIVPIPDLEEQKRISLFVKEINHLITLHQRKITKLKQIKNGLKNSLFLDNNKYFYRKGKNKNMVFKSEDEFEKEIINVLINDSGWKGYEVDHNYIPVVLEYPTEEDIIENWAKILFVNNREKDRLNRCELTKGEMSQIIEQINTLKTPLKLNSFINGKTVIIKRDNENDKLNFGKEVSLKIYDRLEISAGQSIYQIARQPIFKTKDDKYRGDLMLLINGMPVIHVELKKDEKYLSDAYYQIKRYLENNVFTGIFSLVQIFVIMTPYEAKYFANPGSKENFKQEYCFQWADFNNDPVKGWKKITSSLLSIPMAHELIGYYTVADSSDGVLKVMRSYQYYATREIVDRVKRKKWDEKDQLGGFVWHTTGSGKTMTSFKTAQLIAYGKYADKVIFLTDRIELGTQSLKEYRSFSDENESVQATENTRVLISKLKSSDPKDTLIVTSIQKMSNVNDDKFSLSPLDIAIINRKKIVFIVDEAHRSTFGEMLIRIKKTFYSAIFFGFTGTPIYEDNQKKLNTTTTIFGNELHRYSIADGIRDKNVLGFDTYKVLTFKDRDVKEAVALHQTKIKSIDEIYDDPEKSKKYYDIYNLPMPDKSIKDGKEIIGIEHFIPNEQYLKEEHQNCVVEDIVNGWKTLSRSSKFHAIFATNSINEAIKYYGLIKKAKPDLKVTCLFDPNIDNNENFEYKEEGLRQIINDYNKQYNQNFTLATHNLFKKDICMRLAHKDVYKFMGSNSEEQLDLLIVVDQMLTGFDSKWINTLYLDRMLTYENIIQAFSRTNRIFGPEKPFGTIKYYRKPHTMEQNIDLAVKLYSGENPIGLFVDKFAINIKKINNLFDEIKELFENSGINNFEKLPENSTAIAKFASLFGKLNSHFEAAKIQGFDWEINSYSNNETNEKNKLNFTQTIYYSLLRRYKEIPRGDRASNGVAYDLVGYLTEINTDKIDADYMNSQFEKYRKQINQCESEEVLEKTEKDIYNSFSILSQKEQEFAKILLQDIRSGKIKIEENKTFRDYINDYMCENKDNEIEQFIKNYGVDRQKLMNMLSRNITEKNIDEYSRFTDLKKTVCKETAKAYLEKECNKKIKGPELNKLIDKNLREFVLKYN